MRTVSMGDACMAAGRRLRPRAALAAAALALACAVVEGQSRTPVLVTHLSTGPDGEARAHDVEVPLEATAAGAEVSDMFPGVGLTFQWMEPDDFGNWHATPQPKYSITLRGAIEIEVGGGRRVPIGPGNVLFPGDSTGKGHFNHRVSADDRLSAQVLLAPAEECRGQFCVGTATATTVPVTRIRHAPDGRLVADAMQRPAAEVTPIAGFHFLRVTGRGTTPLPGPPLYAIALKGEGTLEAAGARLANLASGAIVLAEDAGSSLAFRNPGPDDSLLVIFPIARR
jgi:hypothetical protein